MGKNSQSSVPLKTANHLSEDSMRCKSWEIYIFENPRLHYSRISPLIALEEGFKGS